MMEITRGRADALYVHIEKFSDLEMSAEMRILLRYARRKLAPVVEGLKEDAEKIISKYNGKHTTSGDGRPMIVFFDNKGNRSPENLTGYKEEYEKLISERVDIDLEKIPMRVQKEQGRMPLDFDIKLDEILE